MSVDRGRAWGWYAIYRGPTGQWAQLLHRVTGLGVVLFLLLHIVDIALLGWGPELYDEITKLYHLPLGRVLQAVLLGAVLYHALNGIRVTVLDFSDWGVSHQRGLFWAAVVVGLLLFVPAAYIILAPMFL